MRFGKLLHQFWADGEEIAAHELEDLANVPKTCAHHFRLVTELLVIHVNFPHRLHPGIFCARVIAFVRGLEPIVNAADEWRNELHPRFGGPHRLREREEQRHIALDAFLLQMLGRGNSFPCGSNFDEHALAPDPLFLVKFHQASRFLD